MTEANANAVDLYRRLGFEENWFTVRTHRQLAEGLDGDPELVPLPVVVDPLRAVKDAAELATIRRAVAISGGYVLVTASTGPFTKQGAVYRRPLDTDERFVRCANGLPEWFEDNIDTFQLAARGAEVAIGTYDGRLFHSRDAGASWTQLADGLDAIHCLALR